MGNLIESPYLHWSLKKTELSRLFNKRATGS